MAAARDLPNVWRGCHRSSAIADLGLLRPRVSARSSAFIMTVARIILGAYCSIPVVLIVLSLTVWRNHW